MKTLPVLLLCALSVFTCSGQPPQATGAQDRLVNKIIRLERNMRRFESKYEGDLNRSVYSDSIRKYNTLLSDILLDPRICKLDSQDWKKIGHATDISVLNSSDGKIGVIAWSVYNPYPNKQCSNVLVNGKKGLAAVSITDTDDGGEGDNMAVDTIIEVVSKQKTVYILVGSNKCGNLCVQYVASLYDVSDGNIVKRKDAFFDGTDHVEDVEFQYRLTDEITTDPVFRVEKDQLICPVFNETRTKQTGTKVYTILP